MNLLIIDDERTILKTVRSQLARMELGVEKIDMAGSAEEAKEYMTKCRYDIFLCDIVMPGEDGIAFAKWVLERHPDVKIIFLTAYADVKYMKEAISMQSFEYVLQPVSSKELRSVVKRAISQIKIERKNLEMMNRGAFFQSREESILEAGTLQYLEGRNEDNSYIRRLLSSRNADMAGGLRYLPVCVQVLKTQKRLDKIERPILRVIFWNILDEVFQSLKISSVILLEERGVDFTVLFYWNGEADYGQEVFSDKLETFRILVFRVLQTSTAIYCGEICREKELPGCVKLLFQARKDNVRQESRIFPPRKNEKDCDSQSYKLQVGTWKKLLDQNQFCGFKDSVLSYVRKDYHGHMNASDMVNLHQSFATFSSEYFTLLDFCLL